MKHEYTLRQLWPLLSRHWFKIGLVIILLYIIFSKDLTFNIHLKAPGHRDTPTQQEEVTGERRVRRETLTDAATIQEAGTVTDRFDFGWGSQENDTKYRLLDRLKQVDESTRLSFIQRFVHVAESEQEKYGVPASITLANSLLWSQAGQLSISKQTNNFFGLPCTPDWRGETTSGKFCYRKYENAWTSFRDHSLYLTTGKLAPLRKNGNDYKKWAKGMERAGFNNEKRLAEQLVTVIEELRLYQYD